MSTFDQDYDTPGDDRLPGQRSRSASWWRWGTVLLIAGMVLAPLVVRQIPREVANWYAASALELRLDGNDDAAREQLATALRWDAKNAAFYLQRAQWNREDQRYEDALADCDKAHELAEQHPLVLIERSQVFQHLKRYADAVQDWKTIAELNERRKVLGDVSVWNGLAYARAVAGLELEAGLEDVQRAVQREPHEAAILDTRGFLFYKLGKHAEALQDLDKAVKDAEVQLAERLKKLESLSPSAMVDTRQAARERKGAESQFAVILYHRSLVLDKLDQPEAAAADRDRVRQLGLIPSDELF